MTVENSLAVGMPRRAANQSGDPCSQSMTRRSSMVGILFHRGGAAVPEGDDVAPLVVGDGVLGGLGLVLLPEDEFGRRLAGVDGRDHLLDGLARLAPRSE